MAIFKNIAKTMRARLGYAQLRINHFRGPLNRLLEQPRFLATLADHVVWLNADRTRRTIMKHLAIIVVLAAMVCGVYLTPAPAFADVAIGEQHDMNFPVGQTFELVQDVLRGEGILFDPHPAEHTLTTLWKPADNSVGLLASVMGEQARYRYEIYVIPLGSQKSRIIANVRTENVPEAQIASYKASARFNLFAKIDQLAQRLPPPSQTPSEGGVNFVLLPNEDLQGLARRVTGNAANWKAIAAANNLKSASDVTPFQTIWVPDRLLKNPAHPASSAAP
jgi:hypothetical protein